MKSLFLIVLNVALIATFTANAATPRQTLASFRTEILNQLKDLDHEIDQLKSRTKAVPAQQKSAFEQNIQRIKSKWQVLNDSVVTLKKVNDQQKHELNLRVADLEHDLDSAERNYSDKQLGLGDLLGF